MEPGEPGKRLLSGYFLGGMGDQPCGLGFRFDIFRQHPLMVYCVSCAAHFMYLISHIMIMCLDFPRVVTGPESFIH